MTSGYKNFFIIGRKYLILWRELDTATLEGSLCRNSSRSSIIGEPREGSKWFRHWHRAQLTVKLYPYRFDKDRVDSLGNRIRVSIIRQIFCFCELFDFNRINKPKPDLRPWIESLKTSPDAGESFPISKFKTRCNRSDSKRLYGRKRLLHNLSMQLDWSTKVCERDYFVPSRRTFRWVSDNPKHSWLNRFLEWKQKIRIGFSSWHAVESSTWTLRLVSTESQQPQAERTEQHLRDFPHEGVGEKSSSLQLWTSTEKE